MRGWITAAVVCLATWGAEGQAPMVNSFGNNGLLTCTNLVPGSVATVEWAASATGPWTNTWAGLNEVTVPSNGQIVVSVPMFYRVRGIPPNIPNIPSGMALIPAGSFSMGDYVDGDTSTRPVHTVFVSAFYMDKTEVTKTKWAEVATWAATNGYDINASSASGKASSHPAYYVTWYECVKWCNARSQMEGLTPCYTVGGATYKSGDSAPDCNWTASGYRLPTEAEWEKAARGGYSGKRFPWGDTITHSQANYYSDASYAYDTSPTRGYHPDYDTGGYPYTSPVGAFAANGYGLYDSAGNVGEWCWDWYDSTYYSSSPGSDPQGPSSSPWGNRAIRGGNGMGYASSTRAAYRYGQPATTSTYLNGFRTVRSVQ